jgi:hypothetical protein
MADAQRHFLNAKPELAVFCSLVWMTRLAILPSTMNHDRSWSLLARAPSHASSPAQRGAAAPPPPHAPPPLAAAPARPPTAARASPARTGLARAGDSYQGAGLAPPRPARSAVGRLHATTPIARAGFARTCAAGQTCSAARVAASSSRIWRASSSRSRSSICAVVARAAQRHPSLPAATLDADGPSGAPESVQPLRLQPATAVRLLPQALSVQQCFATS